MEIWVPTEQLETFASKKVEGLAASKGEEPVSIKKEEPVSKEEEEPVSKEEEEPASKEVEGLAERKEGEGSGDKRKNLWEEGKEYPVKLGESFLKERAKKRLCTFRYSFKPASVDAAGSAKYDALPGREAQVTHQGKVAAGGKAKEVIFQGKTNACVKTECVLIFDEDSNTFVLERLDTAVQSLQPQRRGLHKKQLDEDASRSLAKLKSKSRPKTTKVKKGQGSKETGEASPKVKVEKGE